MMKYLKNNIKLAIGMIAFFLFLVLMVLFVTIKFVFKEDSKAIDFSDSNVTKNYFTASFIKETHKVNKTGSNYLISPYSVETALNMLYEGTNNNSRVELEKYLIKKHTNINNDNIKIANALFIKDEYQEHIETNYTNKMINQFNSEILYDEFKTPDLINSWVNEKTDNMIPTLVDEINEDYVLGIVNALAINTKWKYEFECNQTTEEEFTLDNGKKINVEMMHNTYQNDIRYYDGKDKGIKIPYNENMDFIAILPHEGVDKFIENISASALDDIVGNFEEASNKDKVVLSLPRFSYEYNLKDFKKVLTNMGIKDIFDEEKADLTGIISKDTQKALAIDNLYVSQAIHKTNIDLNESGTKAAAATYVEIAKYTSGMEADVKIHEIKFNEPFVYIIRDSSSHEIIFFGVVYTPNKWNGSTCSEE